MHVDKYTGEKKVHPGEHIILTAENIATTEICRQEHPQPVHKQKMLKDHFLLFVTQGTHEVRLGNDCFLVHKGEMVLLKKATYVEFVKRGNPSNDFIYESVSFSLKKSIIVDFIKLIEIDGYVKTSPLEEDEVLIHPYGARLQTFLESLKPYFDDNEEVKMGLFKLKILELLYDLSQTNAQFLQQLIRLNQHEPADLLQTMENHYLEPHSISDLALISGRSLSSFRRDFETTFRTTPAKWIQEKRMQKARELFLTTELQITEVCYEIGYENVSHFSRLYKSFFGYSPSETKSQVI
ncbi:helix-turn-helix domain-containing protein [Chryseobacterium sp. Mn2064]|uniref:helix-turn-helix domain-containing protein n=1 Tax=Chryseobacterium sp. Mn2064 TaxID=3395263 RepID=UPI003BC1A387